MEFRAKRTDFNGIPGYIFKQVVDGQVMSQQFIPMEIYSTFCNANGISPILESDEPADNKNNAS